MTITERAMAKAMEDIRLDEICSPYITTQVELADVMKWMESAPLDVEDMHRILRVVRSLDPTYSMISKIALKDLIHPDSFAMAAVTYLRKHELENPEDNASEVVDQAVWLLTTVTETPDSMQDMALMMAAVTYQYLAYRFPGAENDLVSRLLETEDGLADNRILYAAMTTSSPSSSVFVGAFWHHVQEEMNARGVMTDWVKKNIPQRSLAKAFRVTGIKEIMRTMEPKHRGRFLEDDLGL